MELNIITPNQTDTSQVAVSDAIFARDYNADLVHQVVVAYQAAARQGSVAQKTRSEVRGGGAKPWRQKGMGKARAGTTRGPIWVGGGRAFAAKPRNYEQKVNKKMYRAAIRVILSRLASDNYLVAVDEFELSSHKTKNLQTKLNELGLDNVLIVSEAVSENLYLAARNLPLVSVIDVHHIDPVSLLSFDKVVLTKSALTYIEEKF